jgi:hypothetical protein
MRYGIDEVLSGMLASIERDTFTDDSQRLGEVFKGLAHEAPLFAPFAALADEADFSAVLEGALQSLVNDGHLERGAGRYQLTPAGRARCITGKRTLFNANDIADLEAGARYFEAALGTAQTDEPGRQTSGEPGHSVSEQAVADDDGMSQANPA